jgi:hypothetical protein
MHKKLRPPHLKTIEERGLLSTFTHLVDGVRHSGLLPTKGGVRIWNIKLVLSYPFFSVLFLVFGTLDGDRDVLSTVWGYGGCGQETAVAVFFCMRRS